MAVRPSAPFQKFLPSVWPGWGWRFFLRCAIEWSVQVTTPTSSTEPVLLRYRNREIRKADLALIGSLAEGEVTRSQLFRAVCEAWGWKQANGEPSIQGCQDLLLRLEERGHIRLPPRRGKASGRRRLPRLPLELIPFSWVEVSSPGACLDTLSIRPKKSVPRDRSLKTADNSLWDQ